MLLNIHRTMSSTISPLGRFNKQLSALCNVLILLYPEDKYFRQAESLLDLGIKTNPRLVHGLFVEHIMKFKDEILEENDDFFLEYCQDKKKREELMKQGEDVMKQYNVKADVMDTIMERCSLYWNQLEEDQKKNIWKYLKVLIVLSQRV